VIGGRGGNRGYHEGRAVLFSALCSFRIANIGVLRDFVFLVRHEEGSGREQTLRIVP